jgi:hypothetical protein
MPSDFDAALARNLAFIRWLTARVAEAGTTTRRAQFLKEHGLALERHFAAVEELVVPALTARGANPELFAALLAHATLRPRLAEVLRGEHEQPALGEIVVRFLRDVTEHLQREAAVLAPLVRRHLSADEASALGERFDARQGSDAVPGLEEPPLAAGPHCSRLAEPWPPAR